jgi:adenine-specific DNA-methyltransferase
MQNLLDELKDLLQQDKKLVVDGKLLKNKIIELGLQLDPSLIKMLLSHKSIKKHFFQEVDGVLVFDKIKFQKFVSNKAFLPDSYTSFKNRIGLIGDNEFITESKEVVLDWPYKDCVLEGGQTEEDTKRNELFWNVILAPDEIDRLFDPKVLTNFKKYDNEGEHDVTVISPQDNLIIKGNNLLALHSIKKIFSNTVKLIYIDPPYNTGNDSFLYNDSFNHSSWLTFMKNRLEVAKTLLSSDGSIWINIDDNEIGYLIALCDEIFGRSNFISLVSVKRSAATGHKAINPSPISVTDYLLGYSKNKEQWKYKITYTKREYDKAYNKFIENYEDQYSDWNFISINEALRKQNVKTIDKLIEKFPERIIRFAEPNYEGVGKETKELIDKSKADPNKIFKQEREDHLDIFLIGGQRILFYNDKLKEIDGELVTAEPLTNFWDDIPFQGIAKEGNVILRKGKKPEHLIKRIIEFSTDPGDIVLDFFLGSGSTAAVANKLKRKYIGIEQLDYGNNDSIQRLANVIKGEQTGISKLVKWDGGGSFIYCELKKLNQQYLDAIEDAHDSETLLDIYDWMKKEAFFNYSFDPTKFDKKAFELFSFNEQKCLLIECLDKNQLYINLNEIEDQTLGITDHEIKLNRLFYHQTGVQ